MVTENQLRREVQKAEAKLNEAHSDARKANAQVVALTKVLLRKGIIDDADLRVINGSAR